MVVTWLGGSGCLGRGLKRGDLELMEPIANFGEVVWVREVSTVDEEPEISSPGIDLIEAPEINVDFLTNGSCLPLQLGPMQVPS